MKSSAKHDIDYRIYQLEKATGYVKGLVPGTQLRRIIGPDRIQWTLSVGLWQNRKHFYTADTIEECLAMAEKELL